MAKVSSRYITSLFFIAAILLTSLSALAAPPDNFTATMISSGMENNVRQIRKFNNQPGRSKVFY